MQLCLPASVRVLPALSQNFLFLLPHYIANQRTIYFFVVFLPLPSIYGWAALKELPSFQFHWLLLLLLPTSSKLQTLPIYRAGSGKKKGWMDLMMPSRYIFKLFSPETPKCICITVAKTAEEKRRQDAFKFHSRFLPLLLSALMMANIEPKRRGH